MNRVPADSVPLPHQGTEACRPGEAADRGVPWRRLDRRMILVDAVQAGVSLAFLALAAGAFGGSLGGGLPLLVVAAIGVLGAVVDAYRWTVTRYRVTAELIERRSGLLVRSYRSVHRDRIRSVDVHAKLRHRLGGLRVVKIGAGQQAPTGEAAFDLDAVSIADAHVLRAVLLAREPVVAEKGLARVAELPDAAGPGRAVHVEVLARFRPGWVVNNVFNVFAYVMALGLMWGAWWLLHTLGVNPGDLVGSVVDWDQLGTAWSIVLVASAVTVLGIVGLGVNFLLEYGHFELARVPTDDGGTALLTRHGLLLTREVSRDDRRLRGVQISEPLPWRWMGMAETTVLTTGLSMWAMSQPAAILPRAPISTARPVAAAALGATPDPFDAALEPHPPAALRRRLWWATGATAVALAVLVGLALTEVIPAGVACAGLVLWPIALGAAVIAFRSLGHAISGDYLVVRSGLTSRATTALQRQAVSTIAIRESLLQRRLGLRTVTAMTSAGYGAYDAPDLETHDAISFAVTAAPGLLDPFLTRPDSEPSSHPR